MFSNSLHDVEHNSVKNSKSSDVYKVEAEGETKQISSEFINKRNK